MIARWVMLWCASVGALYVVGNIIQYNRHIRWSYAIQRAEKFCAALRAQQESLTKECAQLSSLEQVTARLADRHFTESTPCASNNS
jgi:hypothetical protein